MSNQLTAMLSAWHQSKDEVDWVLGTVYKTEGSCYRKAGALTLINSQGKQLGLLSGGCLEADIVRNARKVLQWQRPVLLSYDASDEDDWSYQLGIGCGGKVYIMLQAISAQHDLGLSDMYQALMNRQKGIYHQKINANVGYFETKENAVLTSSKLESRQGDDWLVSGVHPEPHLLIVGGGVDAKPLVNMAKELGWKVSLADPRASHARADNFLNVDVILKDVGLALSQYIQTEKVEAMVMMSHSVDIDAKALISAQIKSLIYVAMLGPIHRFKTVLERAKLTESVLTSPVSAPAGFDIGGQLPESIALSIVSECHSVLHKALSYQEQPLAKVASL